MAKQTINLGTAPGGTDGDTIRTGFDKSNQNFTELYDKDGAHDSAIGAAQAAASAAQATANSALAKATVALPVTYNGDYPTDLTTLAVRFVSDASDPYRTHAPNNYTVIWSLPTNNDAGGINIASQFGGPQQFFMRARNSTIPGQPYQKWKAWVELWHSGNTVVDANNFIKRA